MPVLTDASGRTVITTRGHQQPTRRHRGLVWAGQIVDYAFGLLYALLLLRLLLAYYHASARVGFVHFIDRLLNPFCAPFRALLGTQDLDGGITSAMPMILALIAYVLLHSAIHKLIRLVQDRRPAA